MAWTASNLKAAYRITATDELVVAALNDAEWRVRRYLGERATVLNCRWETPVWEFGERILGLPRLTESIANVSSTQEPDGIDDAYLDGGWTLRRRRPMGFWAAGEVQATLHLVDDQHARDGVIAAMALEHIGHPSPTGRRWNWRRLINEWKGPDPPYRLPDVVTITTGGAPPPAQVTDRLYIGLLAAADSPIDLSGLTARTAAFGATRLTIPAFNDRRRLFVASRSDRPITELSIGAGNIDILPSFIRRRAVDRIDGQDYDAWVSGVPYLGSVAGGQTVSVSR